jgi:hypothetical protein
MAIRVPQPKSFTPCPKGQYSAVCVDVVDLGEQDTGFKDERTGTPKMAYKVDIVWQVSKRMEDGRPFLVSSRYSLSFGEYNGKRSNLLLLLDAWGITTQDLLDESNEHDIERLIGRHCILNVVHRKGIKNPEATYANVASIFPLMPGMEPMEMEGYKRRVHNPGPAKPAPVDLSVFPGDDGDDADDPDSDLPF